MSPATRRMTLLRTFRCLALAVFALVPAAATGSTPLSIALEEMAAKGEAFDAQKLHVLGTDGLAGALDFFFPYTPPAGPSEEETRRLIALLNDDDFQTRERATDELIRQAAPRRALIEEAAKSDQIETRTRAQRVLNALAGQSEARLLSYLSGLRVYLQGIQDSARLELLARRSIKVFESGLPEGKDKLRVAQICIAAVARGRDEGSCDLFRPLLKHSDERVALFVTSTFGQYSAERTF